MEKKYHGDCKGEFMLIFRERKYSPCLNFFCYEHQVMCGRSGWELGWCYKTDSKKIWGKKYSEKYDVKY